MPEQVVNGVRLHYEEHGAGAPILCIHGAAARRWCGPTRSKSSRASAG